MGYKPSVPTTRSPDLTLYHTIPTFNDPEENILGKGENVGNQHLLLFPNCFLPFQKKFQFFGNIYFVVCKCFEFTTQSRLLATLKNQPFKNILGKGENAGNQHFLLLPNCFLPFQKKFQFYSNIYFVICKCCEFGPV